MFYDDWFLLHFIGMNIIMRVAKYTKSNLLFVDHAYAAVINFIPNQNDRKPMFVKNASNRYALQLVGFDNKRKSVLRGEVFYDSHIFDSMFAITVIYFELNSIRMFSMVDVYCKREWEFWEFAKIHLKIFLLINAIKYAMSDDSLKHTTLIASVCKFYEFRRIFDWQLVFYVQ